MKMNRWLLAAAFVLALPQAWGACTVSATGVSFGTYNALGATNHDSTGNVAVTCGPSAPYTIALSPGDGPQAARKMKSGTHSLPYNLFTAATHSIVWGDGTGSTSTVSGSGTAGNHTIYGRIPAAQHVPTGSYSDAITVTVTF